MPIYLPGGRRRSTPAERRNFVAANIRKKCSATGCTAYRKWTSSWCSNHKGRVAAHGHPEGGRLDAGLVETYRLKFSRFLDLYEDTPQVRAALEVMDALLRGKLVKVRSYAQRELRRLREGERHPGDHGTGPITAREGLEVVGGVYWLSLYRPEELPDDVRLSYALATHLFKAKVLDTNITFFHEFLGDDVPRIGRQECDDNPIRLLDYYNRLEERLMENSKSFTDLHVGLRSLAMKFDRLYFESVLESLSGRNANPFTDFYERIVEQDIKPTGASIVGIADCINT